MVFLVCALRIVCDVGGRPVVGLLTLLSKGGELHGLNLSDLRKEYRIYLMPPEQQIRQVARQVMAFLENRSVCSLEISDYPINERLLYAYLPKIIISVRGKVYTRNLLKELVSEFTLFEKTLGEEGTRPVFSRRVTKLIFYGHTDFRLPKAFA